jgi:hypothetical protein
MLCLYTQVMAQGNRTEELIKKISVEKNTYMNAASTDKLAALLDDRMVFVHSNGMTETKER